MKDVREWIECPAGHKLFEVDIRVLPKPIAIIVRCVTCDIEFDFSAKELENYKSLHMQKADEIQ